MWVNLIISISDIFFIDYFLGLDIFITSYPFLKSNSIYGLIKILSFNWIFDKYLDFKSKCLGNELDDFYWLFIEFTDTFLKTFLGQAFEQ